jgi:DNA-binding XRE family transcriptional regulator
MTKKRRLERARDRSRAFRKDPAYADLYREAAADELGAALRSLRETKGLSRREVAEAMGVTRSRISQIEGAEGTALSLEVLDRYARALSCRLEVSFRDEQDDIAVSLFVPSGIGDEVPATTDGA